MAAVSPPPDHPAQPPSAWSKRSTTRASIDGASTHATEANIYNAQPTNSGRLRPKRSVSPASPVSKIPKSSSRSEATARRA